MYTLIVTLFAAAALGVSLAGGVTLRQHLVHHQVEEAISQTVGNEFCSQGYLKFDTQYGPIEGPFQSCHNSRGVTLEMESLRAPDEHITGGQ